MRDLDAERRNKPAERPYSTCDWGYCDARATEWRWCVEHGWLPVCADCAKTMRLNTVHRERVVG